MKKFPIVFFAFKRPDKTKRVLEEVFKSKPYKVYIFADGPRNSEDLAMVLDTRRIIDELTKNFRDVRVSKIYRGKNFGLKKNIIDGLNYVFKNEDAVIVLEDDCLPSLGFFDFCNKALELYSCDYSISTICGTRVTEMCGTENKFLKSRFFVPWGWATWKRTWNRYSKFDDRVLLDRFLSSRDINFLQRWYFSEVYKLTIKGSINTWDYKMIIMQLVEGSFSLLPPFNLIKNIGFGGQSSNTKFKTGVSELPISQYSRHEINFSGDISLDEDYDNYLFRKMFFNAISIIGVFVRKYFPFILKYIYRI